MAMQVITALSLGAINFDQSNYILQDIKGLESPLLRIPRYNLPGSNGAAISNTLFGERAIVIKGTVTVPDNTASNQRIITYLNNRNALINAVSYKRDIFNDLVPLTLTVTLANGVQVTSQVFQDKPLQMGFSMGQPEWEEFQITLVAPDPNLYSTQQSSTTIELASGGGVAIPTNYTPPITYVLSLAPSSGGQAIINNIGANNAFPLITLTGPLTNPYIANLTLNEFIQLNYTIGINDAPVIIDMNAQTITQSNNDISQYKTIPSEFWGLFTGNNNIGFSASAGSGNAKVTFFPSFSGL